jgi:hypothetical protein
MHTRCCSPPESCEGRVMGAIAQAHAGESVDGFFFVGHAVEVLRQHHVFDGGEKWDEMKLLKDESDFLGAHAIQVRGRNAGDVLAVEPDFAGAGTVEAADQIDQRRFTRS